jgi:butyrate kinase
MADYILVINPGSTSTKYGIFSIQENKFIIDEEVMHDKEELAKFKIVTEQDEYRENLILNSIKEKGIELENNLAGIACRGGLLHPLEGGTYAINESMLNDLRTCKWAEHASNLAAIIGDRIAKIFGTDAYIVDSVSTDEFEPVARISGHPKIERICRAHVLNLRAVARKAAQEIDKELAQTNFVGIHMGGGITVAALKKGKFVDVNNALLGEGPFSPERAGTLPLGSVIDMCFSGEFDQKSIKKEFTKKSGLVGYLGTNDIRKIEEMVNSGDEKTKLIFDAFIYQISKWAAAMAAVMNGQIDGVILTGGVSKSEMVTSQLKTRIGFLGRIFIYSGQYEMLALAQGVLRIIKGEEKPKVYNF